MGGVEGSGGVINLTEVIHMEGRVLLFIPHLSFYLFFCGAGSDFCWCMLHHLIIELALIVLSRNYHFPRGRDRMRVGIGGAGGSSVIC